MAATPTQNKQNILALIHSSTAAVVSAGHLQHVHINQQAIEQEIHAHYATLYTKQQLPINWYVGLAGCINAFMINSWRVSSPCNV